MARCVCLIWRRQTLACAAAVAISFVGGCATGQPGGPLASVPLIGPRVQEARLREAVERDSFPTAKQAGIAQVQSSSTQ